MELLQDLGILEYGAKPNRARFGEYLCKGCGSTFIRRCALMTDPNTICSKCQAAIANKASIASAISRGLADFLIRSYTKHGDRYDYHKVVYTGDKQQVEIVCKIHGSFLQLAGDHSRNGSGCQKCASMARGWSIHKHDVFNQCILYLVYFNELDLYKIGITKRSISTRLYKEHRQYSIIYEIKVSTCAKAYFIEQSLHKMYKEYNYTGSKVLDAGNSELFTSMPNDYVYNVGILTNLYKEQHE